MRKPRILSFSILFLMALFLINCFAQEGRDAQSQPQEAPQPQAKAQENQTGSVIISDKQSIPDLSENITLDFTEADIRNVLKIISYKSGVNIVTTPEVIGNITIRLVDVPWEKALDVILKTYGFGYVKQGNIILVSKLENISKLQAEEQLVTEIFTLKFLDAQDAERAIIPMLSSRGKVSVLYARGQKGWQFGTFKIGKEQVSSAQLEAEKNTGMRSETVSIEKNPEGRTVSTKVEFESSVKSRTLIVTDTVFAMDKIRSFIQLIDKKPKQVLIETRIMEVNKDKLKDFGFDWGTGTSGASGYATDPADVKINNANTMTLAGRNLASEATPSVFGPLEGTSASSGIPGTSPYKAGLELLFKKLTGAQFEVILHALEEDVHTNTLSAPRILTLDNQEASILVGFHTPILASTVTAGSTSTGTGATVTQTLDYYQEIGIRLNVVPQISEEGYINMIIHPSVTSSNSNIDATSVASGITTTTSYPIIDVREAQTQVLMRDNETIVIGGLMKDVKSKQTIGIPFLSKIPFLGKAFTRETTDISKIDLLIFITAHVLGDDEPLSDQILQSENKFETGHASAGQNKKAN